MLKLSFQLKSYDAKNPTFYSARFGLINLAIKVNKKTGQLLVW